MTHARLRQLVLVNFRLEPEVLLCGIIRRRLDTELCTEGVLTCVEDKDIIHDALFTVALAPAKNDQVLPELSG